LAQGAASKRPDFIAQLRQHLQDLPAHEQVAINIQRAVREGTGRLSIQLSPSELGQIHVKLEIDEEKRVTAAVTVEKPSTLELLQRDIKGLERALHNAGLQMDGNDLSFSLGRQDSQEFAQDLRQSGTSARGQEQAGGEADTAAPAASAVDTASGLVNVEV
ncbi:MAG TPA: flagellar hook-length control protein FliK, partial [Alphaproteobacteria bacterium]|nr:flagellar hook-length control protein FliK [Alphaproteobacteria bacterium]